MSASLKYRTAPLLTAAGLFVASCTEATPVAPAAPAAVAPAPASPTPVAVVKEGVGAPPADRTADELVRDGIALAKRGKLDAAADWFAAARTKAPDHPGAAFNGALAALQLKRAAEASSLADAFVRLRPDDAIGWFLLGQARAMEGAIPQAEVALRRSVTLGFSDFGAWDAADFGLLEREITFVALTQTVAQRAGVRRGDRRAPDGAPLDNNVSNYGTMPLTGIVHPDAPPPCEERPDGTLSCEPAAGR